MSELTMMIFGLGDKEIDTGTVGDKPCVFVTQLPITGTIGELIPDALKHHVPKEPHFAMIFPTAEQAKRVADAMCMTDRKFVDLCKDASRYRHLRNGDGTTVEILYYDDDGCEEWVSGYEGKDLDDAIDLQLAIGQPT